MTISRNEIHLTRRCSLLVVGPRLTINLAIFFIEENCRGYWYVCKIHFATPCKKGTSCLAIVSLRHATMCTTCRSLGFIWCNRDISSSILSSVAPPDGRVSCASGNRRLWTDRSNERREKAAINLVDAERRDVN